MGPYDTGRFADIPPEDVAAVKTAGNAAQIVERMLADLNGAGRDVWENVKLDRFLDALSGVLNSSRYEPQPSWWLWRSPQAPFVGQCRHHPDQEGTLVLVGIDTTLAGAQAERVRAG